MSLTSSRVSPRLSFAKTKKVVSLPNLIDLQKRSYDEFLQIDCDPKKRPNIGLQEIFEEVFPVKSFSGDARLEFSHYTLEEPRYDVDEARKKGTTFSSALRVTFRLVSWDTDSETGNRSIRAIKEQDVYMGDVPLMTKHATFVINGVERVVVAQVLRSPGVFFDDDGGRTHASGKHLFSASVRPFRGSWLDFEFDARDMLYVRIDKKRKMYVSTFLMALPAGDENENAQSTEGMSREAILKHFYDVVPYKIEDEYVVTSFCAERWKGVRLTHTLIDHKSGEELIEQGKKLTGPVIRDLLKKKIQETRLPHSSLIGKYLAEDVINGETGEIYAEGGDEISEDMLETLRSHAKELRLLDIDHIRHGSYLRDVLMADRTSNRQSALFEIYRALRPGDPPTFESASNFFQSLFFETEKYDLSTVGRVKTNARLGLDKPESLTCLSKEDILGTVRVLLELRNGRGTIDDIDSLSNRRVRAVGEMLGSQYKLGLLRLERSIKERMSSLDENDCVPQNVLNAKPLAAVMRDFFSSSQLSQFMDQTNPLSEITHKRRFSALGPGGLAKERASIEVRDVHPTHYGRICPVETPEGQSIGLINSMASYARVNAHGFVETPYARVTNGRVTDEIVHLSAIEESRHTIAQGNAIVDDDGALTETLVSCRNDGDYVLVPATEVNFIDVSPKQILSVAASLIPFVENDDASRALMGSNMQRQAVPLLKPQAPFVGTGMERIAGYDSGCTLVARRSGVVTQVDGNRIVVLADQDVQDKESADASPVDIYNLTKFQKTNHGTCINQRPVVDCGERVEMGQMITDGPAIDRGELALGSNVVTAFMPWNGYGFEDSIIVSERLVQNDTYTSVHIEEYEISARDTKLGNEEVTRDIPGAGEEMLQRLDESGIVYVGAEVKAGDILVGKVTPKGDSPMTSEEKLLRAIFGEKAMDMRDTSLRMPPGSSGTVVDVRVFSRRGIEADERSQALRNVEISRLTQDHETEKAVIEGGASTHLCEILTGATAKKKIGKVTEGQTLTKDVLESLAFPVLSQVVVQESNVAQAARDCLETLKIALDSLKVRFDKKVGRVHRGDDLPAGVLKTVRVFVAIKRKLQIGDKMAGRHGNKGVVSKVLPVEDMPYLEDGTPVDMVLNPLGLPSRMNVGQILETHLGWAARGMGKKIESFLKEQAVQKTFDFKKLREVLKSFYGLASKPTMLEDIDQADDETLLAWATGFSRGLPTETPVFEGPKLDTVGKALESAGLDPSGQSTLYDGRTGEAFDRKVTVGVLYMLKLHHLIDEKIHARSVGPYSLITQQPLGGKSNLGGQRLGEMEVWALEGYGAAYTLREMLTVKSDDTEGRTRAYEAIIRGNTHFECGVPASFNVLVKELRALGLNVDFLSDRAADLYGDHEDQARGI